MEQETKKGKVIQDFFINTLNGMAYGLFATLIVGTIFAAIGFLFSKGNNDFCKFMVTILGSTDAKQGISWVLQVLTGAGIGVGVALSLKFNPLQTIVLAAVGFASAYLSLGTSFVTSGTINNGAFQIGDPLTIYLVCIASALAMKFVLRKKTPVDIILVPLFGIIVGLTGALLIRFPAIYVTYGFQWLINEGTKAVPFIAVVPNVRAREKDHDFSDMYQPSHFEAFDNFINDFS